MARFVVQQHFRSETDRHFDVMLQRGEALVTFASPVAPDDDAHLPALVRRLPDHRLAYLEKEGEVSGGRGWTRIHDRGAFEWLEPEGGADISLAERIRVRIDAERAEGVYELVPAPRAGTDHWRLRRCG